MANLEVAQTILEQLGGSRFLVMTGARGFTGEANGLQFSIPLGAARVNKIRVVLDASDTYTITAYYIRPKGLRVDLKGSESGVYCDQLQAAFTRLTGLDTKL